AGAAALRRRVAAQRDRPGRAPALAARRRGAAAAPGRAALGLDPAAVRALLLLRLGRARPAGEAGGDLGALGGRARRAVAQRARAARPPAARPHPPALLVGR